MRLPSEGGLKAASASMASSSASSRSRGEGLSLDAPASANDPLPSIAPMHDTADESDTESESDAEPPKRKWGLKRQKKQNDQPRDPLNFGTFMGVQLNPLHIVGAVLALVVVGYAVMYYRSLTADFKIVQAQSVDAIIALPNVGYKATNEFKLGGKQPNPDFIEDPPKGIIELGGNDVMAVTHPDPKGGFILVHAEISQQIMHEEKMESGYDMAFRSTSFKVTSGSETIEPWLILTSVDSGFQPSTYAMRTADPNNYLPTTIKPDKKETKKDERGRLASGVYTWDGSSGWTGDFKFRCGYYHHEIYGDYESLVPQGTLKFKSASGATVKYDYKYALTIAWTAGCDGWVSKSSYIRAEGGSMYAKFPVTLLFPKPKNPGATITFQGRKVAEIDTDSISAGTTLRVVGKPGAGGAAKPTATPAPSATASADKPGDKPAVPAAGAGDKPAGAADAITDPLTGYLGAVTKARKKALGVMGDLTMAEIAKAIFMYVEQNGGQWPKNLDEVEAVCPGTKALAATPPRNGSDGYLYVQPKDPIGKIKSPETTPIIFESKGGKPDYTGNACYADGHVGRAPEK